jgi:hypothetical protein
MTIYAYDDSPTRASASVSSQRRPARNRRRREGTARPTRGARMGATIGGGEFTCAAGASQLRNFLAIIG